MTLDMHIKPTNGLEVTPADSSTYKGVRTFLLGRMGGRNSTGYQTIMNSGFNIEKATGSSLAFVIAATEPLQEENIATLSLEDAIKIIAHDQAEGTNHFEGIYSDIKEAILYTNDKSQLSTNLADIAKNQENISYDAENPARFIGLGIDKDNKQGYKFVETEKTKVITDPRFSHKNNEQKVEFSGTNIKVFTKSIGSSWLCAYDVGLGARSDIPAYSYDSGRVGLVHAEGVGSKKSD